MLDEERLKAKERDKYEHFRKVRSKCLMCDRSIDYNVGIRYYNTSAVLALSNLRAIPTYSAIHGSHIVGCLKFLVMQ